MIEPPSTYSEWVDVLNMLKNKTDDEEVVIAMKNGTINWQSGVAERFLKKMIEVVNYRMNLASDKFQRDLSRARGEERVIIQALLSLRKEMSFIFHAVDIPALPEREREQYKNLVIEQADNMQSSLEDSAKKDRTGKLSVMIRNHKVNAL